VKSWGVPPRTVTLTDRCAALGSTNSKTLDGDKQEEVIRQLTKMHGSPRTINGLVVTAKAVRHH
jgi:hypothetical protein